jgi:hypothetical protein
VIAHGSLWRHVGSGNVYQFIGENAAVDACYRFALRLVSRNRHCLTPLGYVMHVEHPWFAHAAKPVAP